MSESTSRRAKTFRNWAGNSGRAKTFRSRAGNSGRSKTFRNWAGNQVCVPHQILRPESPEEVATIVRRVAETGLTVKAVGAGHSFTDAACTQGILVSLDRLDAVTDIDADRGRVTVQSGIRLHALNRRLDGAGLALPNLGDIDRQSLGGAVATATHGTGLGLGNLSTTVVGMDIVNGAGELIRCDTRERPELLRVARVGVGALGIVTAMTLQCVPAFDLHATETVEPLDDLLDGFEQQVAGCDHLEFFWMPGARRAHVKRNNRTDEPRRRQHRLARARDKILYENVAFGLANRTVRRFPSLAPTVARLAGAALPQQDYVDASHRVFVSRRLVRFYEMEYGVPLSALPEAVRRVGDLASSLPSPITFPIEVRVSAADDIALSTAFGRDTGWFACHTYVGTPYLAYFQGVEAIAADYGGRPHWGKLHFGDHRSLAPLYPEWDRFQQARSELDPDGTFSNSYTDRVLGPIA